MARPRTGRKLAGSLVPASRICNRTPNPQTQCNFFSLPPELRNEIYSLVLEVPPETSGPRFTLNLFSEPENEPSILAILQTCSLIRNEAEDLFFKQQHFKIYENIPDLTHIKTLLRFATPERIYAISKLTVLVSHMEDIHKFLRLSHNFKGLAMLKLVVIQSSTLHPCVPLSFVEREIPLLKKSALILPTGITVFEVRLFNLFDDGDEDEKTERLVSLNAWVVEAIATKRQKGVE